MTKEGLGFKIKELRSNKGISQEELGKVLGRSHAAVSDIERGKTDLSVQDLSVISNFFQTPLSYFVEDLANQSFVSFNHHRYSKDISPLEKRLADKASGDFDKYAKEFLDKEAKEND